MTATTPTKGAGTTFWRLKDGTELPLLKADFLSDEKWEQIAQIKEITPGEITVEDEDDSYLDDPEAEWTKTAPGQKSAGEVSLVIAWKPGETAQQRLVDDVDKNVVTMFRAKYPNDAVDVWNGYINSLGKAVAAKDKMTRSVKIKCVGKPVTAEELLKPEAPVGG
ncbi:phage tail tube protein [Vibrio cholerae]|nr:phage tail protein [Vibrio cholerae]